MEWLVIDSLYLRTTGNYALILHAGELKMLAEVTSAMPVSPGDILYPVKDAIYLINNRENSPLNVISAVAFSVTHWNILKKLNASMTEPA
jgi:signal transduction protein PmrD